MDEKILARISKLLAMAKDTSSPEEAAIAAQRARSLMDKHQIEEFQVPGADGTFKEAFATNRAGKVAKELSLWRQWVATGVARYNDCIARLPYVDNKGKRSQQVEFSGYESDVYVATAMYEYLCNTVEMLAKSHCKILPEGVDKKVAYANFCKGAGSTLGSRLKALCKERDEQVSSNGTAVMVVKADAVKEHFGEAEYKQSRTRYTEKGIDSAVYGAQAAKSISIHAQVGGQNAKLIK